MLLAVELALVGVKVSEQYDQDNDDDEEISQENKPVSPAEIDDMIRSANPKHFPPTEEELLEQGKREKAKARKKLKAKRQKETRRKHALRVQENLGKSVSCGG